MRGSGDIGSDEADMSSTKPVRKRVRESPRVPAQGLSTPGLVGPKVSTKVVADGNTVNILQPALVVKEE